MSAEPTQKANRYDVVIVGIGPAGLAAAAVLGRSARSVALVGVRERGNAGATEVHNLPYAESIAPGELFGRMERELDKYAIPIFPELVEDVSVDGSVTVRTADRTLVGSRLLLANGTESVVPEWVPDGSWGTTVFDCPFCHAYEHRGDDFVVAGPRQMTVDVALLCTAQARSTTVVVADPAAVESEAAQRVRQLGGEVLHGTIQAAVADGPGKLGLITSGGRRLSAGAVLLTGTTSMRSTFVEQLGLKANEFGVPATDSDGKASHSLVWVAGTAARPYYVMIEAMASGIRSAIAIHKDLAHEGLSGRK